MLEYIRYRIDPERAEAFEDAYRRAGEVLDRSPACRGFDVARCVEEPGRYVVRIRWTSLPDHLDGFRKGSRFPEFLSHVRPFIADIEEMQHYDPIDPQPPSLYEWAGGSEALTRWFELFYQRVPDDPVLAPVFAAMPAEHHVHVAMWVAEVLGGPAEYTAERGGHLGMIRHHLGRHLTETQRQRWLTMLLAAADDVGLPADPEFRASLVAYLEWGTRLAVVFSARTDDPDVPEPVPLWDWVRPPWPG